MKKLLLLLLATVSLNAYANIQLHKCFLLPITDNLQGAVSDEIFSLTQSVLRSSSWCELQENPKLLTLLTKYKKQLGGHLKNSEVIKLVSLRSNAGSIIRVKLKYKVKDVTLNIDVIDSNGTEYLLRDEYKLKDDSIANIMTNIKTSLNNYSADFPYQGVVVDTVADNIIIKAINGNKFVFRDELEISRPISPIKHPLLKKVVEWNVEKIGVGKVERKNKNVVTVKINNPKIKKGFWVGLKRPAPEVKYIPTDLRKARHYAEFFEIKGLGLLSMPKAANSYNSVEEKFSGYQLGIDAEGALNLTQNIVTIGRIHQSIGLLGDAKATTKSTYKLDLGYRYNLSYENKGTYIIPFLGYHLYSYNVKEAEGQYFGTSSFDSFTCGLLGSYEFNDIYTLNYRFDLGMSSSASHSPNIYGSSTSTRVGSVELGLRYNYEKHYDIYGGIEHAQSSAYYGDDSITYSSTNFKAGLIYKY